MISGMGGSIPLIAMRGGATDLSQNTVDTSQNTVDTSQNIVDSSGITVNTLKNSINTKQNNISTSQNTVDSSRNTVNVSGDIVDSSGNTIDASGNTVDSSGITWEGKQYLIPETRDQWDENNEDNFLNFLGIPKAVFSSDEEYIEFSEGISNCLNDSSSADSACESVNNILRRVIELRIKDLVEQERFGNVQKVMNVISFKEPDESTETSEKPAEELS